MLATAMWPSNMGFPTVLRLRSSHIIRSPSVRSPSDRLICPASVAICSSDWESFVSCVSVVMPCFYVFVYCFEHCFRYTSCVRRASPLFSVIMKYYQLIVSCLDMRRPIIVSLFCGNGKRFASVLSHALKRTFQKALRYHHSIGTGILSRIPSLCVPPNIEWRRSGKRRNQIFMCHSSMVASAVCSSQGFSSFWQLAYIFHVICIFRGHSDICRCTLVLFTLEVSTILWRTQGWKLVLLLLLTWQWEGN